MKLIKLKKKNMNRNETRYPSASFLCSACYEDYRRLIDTYDKIYEKINIALGFAGVILLVILQDFDYTIFGTFGNVHTHIELIFLHIQIACSIVSAVSIVWAVIQLLLLTRSKPVPVFDSVAIRNDKLYDVSQADAALWLIDKYTFLVCELREINQKKQKEFDSAIVKILISLLAYALLVIIQRGA